MVQRSFTVVGEPGAAATGTTEQTVNGCGLDGSKLRQHCIGGAVLAFFEGVREFVEQFFRSGCSLRRRSGNSYGNLATEFFRRNEKGQETTGERVGLASTWATGEHVE